MTHTPRPWTAEELERLREISGGGASPEAIARLLERDQADVEERLAILAHSSMGRTEPSMGPDEEGDVIPALGREEDDPAAWVHSNEPR